MLLKSSRNGFFARFGKVLIIGLITILTSTTWFFIYQKLTSPVDAMFKSFTQVSAGHDHSLALASDGTIYAWGMGSNGQLGNGTTTNSTVPVAVTTTGTPMAGKTITSISAGYYHSLALASDGTVYAWGGGSDGQLGNSTTADSSVPVAVTTSGTPMSGKTITAISAGYSHSLVLASDGTVYAWGLGTYGRLGNSSSSSSNKPVAVTTTGTPMAGKTITAVSAGNSHSLALASNGTVYAWGNGNDGRLGNSSSSSSNKPVAVTTSSTPMSGKTITAILAGSNHSLALASDGTVYAWGRGSDGQLGNSSTSSSNKPVAVTTNGTPMAGKTITAISAGSSYSLVLASDGTVYTWGSNSNGQLGNSSTSSSNKPVAVTTTSTPMAGKTISAISAGSSYSLVLASDGTVYAWGDNSFGQLGNGTTTNSNKPVAVIPLASTPSTPTNITTTPGNNSIQLNWSAPIETFGQTITGYSLQYRVEGSSTWITTNISGNVTSYTQSSLTNNQKYQLRLAAVTGAGVGDYSNILLSTPHATPTITSVSPNIGTTAGGTNVTITGEDFVLKEKNIVQVAAGYYHMLALDSDGIIYAWGSNDYGQLGDNTTTDRQRPVAVNGPESSLAGKRFVKISAGHDTSFAIDSSGKAYAWGDNNHGQIGRPIAERINPIPTEVDTAGTPMAGKKIVDIVSGQATTVALDSNGVLYSWGYNEHGELGQGTATGASSPTPGLVAASGSSSIQGKKITSVVAGEHYFLAIDSNGKVHSWGFNQYGEIGNGTQNTSSTSPTLVKTADTPMAGKVIVDVAAGMWHSVAVDSNGQVYTWGDGEFSQLGNGMHGTGVDSLVPVAVVTAGTPMAGKKIVDVAAGGTNYYVEYATPSSHSLALADDGSVYAWGTNHVGEIGTGTSAGGTQYDKPVAVDVVGTPMAGKSLLAISAGIFSSIGLSSDGNIYTWGNNSLGQLGDGTVVSRLKPVSVSSTAPSALAPSVSAATFGGTTATNVILVSPTQITATTPAHAAGLVNVSVDLGSEDPSYMATLTNGYTYGDPPSVPVSLVATPQDSGVRLSWSVPTSNGGFPITNYIVQYSADGGATWNTYNDGISTSTTVTVPSPTPLNAATNYTFRVSAANTIGQGGWSNTTTGRVRYITVSAPASVVLNVTPTGGTRMSSSSHNVTVSTNGALGYNLLLSSTSTNRNLVNGSSSITPTAGSQVSPINLSNSSWGYRVPGIGGFGTGSGVETNTTVSSYTWAGIPANSSPATIRTQTSAVNNDLATVWYGVSITPDQRSGSYTSTVVYTAVTRD